MSGKQIWICFYSRCQSRMADGCNEANIVYTISLVTNNTCCNEMYIFVLIIFKYIINKSLINHIINVSNKYPC